MKKLGTLAVVLLVAAALAGCSGGGGGNDVEDEDVIKIGSVSPTTGPVATFGQSVLDATSWLLKR